MKDTTILNAAVALTGKDGLASLTRARVARRARVSVGLVNYHFTTMRELRRRVIEHAVHCELVPVLAKIYADSPDEINGRMYPALREKIAAHITKA